MTRKLLALLVFGAIATAPAVASAQLSTSFSIAGGLAMPHGDGSDQLNSGYNLAAGLNLGAPLLPVGVRVEGAYNAFEMKGNTSLNSASANIASGTVNATLGLGLPYVIGGIGYYSAGGKATINGVSQTVDRTNAFGVNGGVGVRLPLGVMSTFAEVRYHKAMGDIDSSYIPITFGIQF